MTVLDDCKGLFVYGIRRLLICLAPLHSVLTLSSV